MQPLKRQQFICSAIEQCKETVNCCAHKQPHIKDERCVPRECRYAIGIEGVDCMKYPIENPVAPVPVKAVEESFKETQTVTVTVDEATPELIDAITQSKETDIKEAVKKQSASRKKGGRKKA